MVGLDRNSQSLYRAIGIAGVIVEVADEMLERLKTAFLSGIMTVEFADTGSEVG